MTDSKYLDILKTEDVAINVLAVNASPRVSRISNSQILLDYAKEAAGAMPAVTISEFSFAQKEIAPCHMCISYCSKHQECVTKDDFQEFRSLWLKADAVIWSVPIYHMGPPSIVRAALDRMNELRFQTSHAHGQTQYPRLNKVVGTIVQGGSRFGGQEITHQFFLHHSMLLQCIPVTGNMPEQYLGTSTQTRSREALLADEEIREQCHSLGRRVAEMAKIVKAGLLLAQESLPDEYFPSTEKMGLIQRREIV